MTPRPIIFSVVVAVASSSVLGVDNPKLWYDAAGDSVERRTDVAMAGSLDPAVNRPNVLKLAIGAWQATSPATDPFAGIYCDPQGAGLFRLDLELKGLVNPPGPATESNYQPFVFGPNPVFGAIEIDIDGDPDTGGELGTSAKSKYLANVGRFGRAPYGPIAARAARFGWEVQSPTEPNFFTDPQVERSGADFLLAFCGCYETTITPVVGNLNGIFESGETWLVRSGFFQRAGGYQSAGTSTGGASGLAPGLYTPWVRLRWSHNVQMDTTTITLVYALTMAGAGQLAGQPPQLPNHSTDDQNSIVEALTDLQDGIPGLSSGSAPWVLAHRWAGRDPAQGIWLDPTRWEATALVGTAYPVPQNGAFFVWTDTGFKETQRDLTGDGISDESDKQAVIAAIEALDGTIRDAEGSGEENGGVQLILPGLNFAMADVSGDGHINRFDVRAFCAADFNLDGVFNIFDYISFFDAFFWGDLRADLNINGRLDSADFIEYMNAAAGGC